MLLLKNYQQRALDTLRTYLRRCTETSDADAAFYSSTRESFGTGVAYRSAPGFAGLPYVCIRIPTGGGKTLVACHAVEVATTELLQTETPVVLWLVPSTTIQEQTLGALRKPAHPYRQALDSFFANLNVLELEEALYLTRPQVDSGCTIIVSTMQAFRVEDRLGRRVYRENGNLMPHFEGLPTDRLASLEKYEGGKPIPTLANVLNVRRPLVIVDEAHNARTDLSFETLGRFNPACILEFTATPDTQAHPSNVLHSASARELKAEAMIKMPIRLETRPAWKELLSDAISRRNALEKAAEAERRETGEHLRPIMLIQAQPHAKRKETVTVETVHQALLADFAIPPEQVAIATGSQKDLQDVDVLSEECPLRYIITMQALREGWDCPFAYVLCSVADISSPTYVEQVLGRVMRLPRAARKVNPDLNVAYAFAASQRFIDAASALTDALVENGFEREEARKLIVPARAEQRGTLFAEPLEAPRTPGEARPPAERGIPFSVPVLAVRQGDLLEQLEDTHFLDYAWELRKCDPSLSPQEYSPASLRPQVGEVDIAESGKLSWRFIEQLHEDTRLFAEQDWSLADLVLWLDRTIRHEDIGAQDSGVFLTSVLLYLTEKRGIPLADLVRDRYGLRRAVTAKIGEHRAQARKAANERLFADGSPTPVVVSPECCFTYRPDSYAPNALDTHHYAWRRHYYRDVALFDGEEEFECAQHIDQLEQVEFWVRNIANRPSDSFWIQTRTDKFYPDFVCKLSDGCLLVVEYKGQRDWSTDDSKEKRALGEVWEKRSEGRCLFLMVTAPDYDAVERKVEHSSSAPRL